MRPNSPRTFLSFNNGQPITPLFNAGERALAESMKGYWDGFVRQGSPATRRRGLADLPRCGPAKSLHANGRSFVLSTEQFNREHNCKFWEENEQ